MTQAKSKRSAEEIQAWLIAQISTQSGLAAETIHIREPFTNFGLSSREAIVLSGDMEEWLGRSLSPTLLFDYPDIAALSQYLAGQAQPHAPAPNRDIPPAQHHDEPTAIIGIGCRFPQAPNPTAFWRLLRDGVDAVTTVPTDRPELADFYRSETHPHDEPPTHWGGFLEQIDRFDPRFFGISPREAHAMDPQQRLLLETAQEALEDAGLPAAQLTGSNTGVFIGVSTNDYGQTRLHNPTAGDIYIDTGNAFSIAANRISYVFDFHGPSLAIDTACSSSLMAIHLAHRSLGSGETDLALAGGVNIILSPYITENFRKAGLLAKDGRCKSFDARADGYVRGEGAGVVVLKRIHDALRDGDPIYAVIRGSAANQSGRSNGLTAPNGPAQEAVMRTALRQAGVSPAQVQYIEAHGTGTAIGDPIEAGAIGRALSQNRSPADPCLIGSVKTNIGHLEAASGVAGVIKAALALQKRILPASLHFQQGNPLIPFTELKLQVQQQTAPWPTRPGPALAGINSYGFGGANVFIVLEQAPSLPGPAAQQNKESPPRTHTLPLSAHTPPALKDRAQSWLQFINETEPEITDTPDFIYNICYTAARRRDFHEYRLAVSGRSKEEISRRLADFLKGETAPPAPPDKPDKDERDILAASLAAQFTQGAQVDWRALYPQAGRCLRLPTYPWQRERFWIEAKPTRAEQSADVALLTQERDSSVRGKIGLEIIGLTDPAKQQAGLTAYLNRVTAKTLGIPPEKLDVHQPMNTYGLDSLMAVEIKNQVEFDMNIKVSMVQFLANPSVEQIAGALLEQLTQAQPAPGIAAPTTTTPTPVFPLSYGQRALWFLYRAAPESAAYNIGHAAYIRPRPDARALKQAFQLSVERHPALRTVFHDSQGGPVQQVEDNLELDFQQIDAAHVGDEDFAKQLRQEADRPFDLGKGPILRVRLFHRSDGKTVLALTVHHIAVDFWSLEILLHDVQTLYRAVKQDRPIAPAAPQTQYRDFVSYQAEMLAGPEGERPWAYWKQQLQGDIPPLDIPTDRPRPRIQSFRGAIHSFALSDELTEKLRQIAKDETTTLFSTMLAAFFVLLYRSSGQDDIVVGVPTAGRTRPEFERTVGYFVNPVPIRVRFADPPTFRELIHQVQQTVFAGLEHQEFPFPLLVEKLQPRRDTGRSPIFQVDFVWEKARRESAPDEEITFDPFISEQRGAAFDITCRVFEASPALTIALQYNLDLFDEATIKRMGERFQALLAGAAQAPGDNISHLPLLTEEELQQMLIAWNDTDAPLPGRLTLAQLFESQVEATPQAPALVLDQADQNPGEETRLTYREMNARCNRLSYYLRKRGVQPGVLAALYMERSIEMVIGIYGIAKAGGAYVPLDPEYPPQRISFILKDTAADIILTQRHLIPKLPPHAAQQTICLDADWDQIAGESPDNPENRMLQEDIAYSIYTSGSTGQPKGALISHVAICNRLIWMQAAYCLTPQDNVLQKTPFSFDVSVWEFFWPLLYGASLVIARPTGHQDCAYLIAAITRHNITTIHFVPPMLKVFLDEPGVTSCTSLKRVICSGEALSPDLRDKFFARLKAELYNLYGPTEAAVDVTHFTCIPEDKRNIVPIGRPIHNIKIYILDRSLQPTPLCTPGELHIAGVGLARGYTNRPELTVEKFIKNPASGGQGKGAIFQKSPLVAEGILLYKTGDLARWLPDGSIEFLGRLDFQVKVRGLRIELGEIEAMLVKHPAVRQAAVVSHEASAGDNRLVAYLVPADESIPNTGELRLFLKEKLPEYMIPQAFVVLPTLPLTASGKIDRRALPLPDTLRPELSTPFAAPQSDLENTIAAIWKDILHIEKVGLHDNFFDLGGHSLLMIQVHNRLREIFALDMSIMEMFQYPTVGALAGFISKGKSEARPLQDETRIDMIKQGKERLRAQLKRKQQAAGGDKKQP